MFNQDRFYEECNVHGFTLDRVARELGINYSTLYRKIKGESDFTRSEIQNLIRLLALNASDVNSIFFAQ